MNVAVQFLLPLPEMVQMVTQALMISFAYFPILAQLSLESPLDLEVEFLRLI